MNLLLKPAGGYSPIIFFLVLEGVWTRARKEVASKREVTRERGYLYGGKGKAATTAAWMVATRAERSAMDGTAFAQVLLDLVKAFEYV